MAIFNYAAREMTAKIVYYGPGLSGKTTSIQYIHSRISPKNRGKLVSLATETDRTLFFDFFPVEFGRVGGFKIKFNFYTVPGQVFYNTTRKLVLKGADGVVFVADSQPGMMEQNLESLENLKENLKAHGLDWETIPFVIQYNKRDIPGAMPVEEMRRRLNPRGVPDFETVATTGQGVMEAMKTICKMVLADLQKKQRRAAGRAAAQRPPDAAQPPQAEAAPVRTEPAPEPPPPPPEKEPAPAPAEPSAPPEPPAPSAERSVVVPVQGPGRTTVDLAVPLELQLPEGVDAVEVRVSVRVEYRGPERGSVTPGAVRAETRAGGDEARRPKKRGLFARMFGRGD